jgi:plasmid rolling circle replication initiator protein Rep
MKAAQTLTQDTKFRTLSISKHNCGKDNKTKTATSCTNESENGTRENYRKRAKAKFAQNRLLQALVKLDSPLKKQYEDTQFCSWTLLQNGNTLTAKYCKQRWCRICNRIRTGKLISGYEKAINEMLQPQFVTLTIPNVPAEELRETMQEMLHNIRRIQDLRRKNKKELIKGIRKLECTYNVDNNNYHPHLHLIVDNIENALHLRKEWLKRYPTATTKAQDIKKAKEPIELFKYFAKLTSKSKKDTITIKGKKIIRDEWHYPKALDTIFQAITNMRIIQPMGGIRMVSDEIEEVEAVEMQAGEITEDRTLWKWTRMETEPGKYTFDWVDQCTGEMLTGFYPTEREWKYSNRIRNFET